MRPGRMMDEIMLDSRYMATFFIVFLSITVSSAVVNALVGTNLVILVDCIQSCLVTQTNSIKALKFLCNFCSIACSEILRC